MNTLETTLKELLELSYTPEEIRNTLEEVIEGIKRPTNEETDDK